MLKTIIHGVNLARNALRDVGNPVKRSSKWEKLEHEFKATHPLCAACGSIIRLNVHHCVPFHLDSALELDPTNLITLCMDTNECHLRIGHAFSFKFYSPAVRQYAHEVNTKQKTLEQIWEIAKNNRVVN